jgi:hypothetical protein
MNSILHGLGRKLAGWLVHERTLHSTIRPTPEDLLRRHLRIGDVLLVEGSSRVSSAIKYLTQSTWSHAALFVGDLLAAHPGAPATGTLIEADIVEGVRAVPLAELARFPTRICRPLGLDATVCRQVALYAIGRIGLHYDLRNIFDLARYLLPNPPVPIRFRRRLLALGSGDPTRAICSTLIAQAFQSVRYPILPLVERRRNVRQGCVECEDEIYHVRHHSLFTPRDFDVSPYFAIVKPTLEETFDYQTLNWE